MRKEKAELALKREEKKAIDEQAPEEVKREVVKQTTKEEPKKEKKGLSKQFKTALTHLAPQAIGMLVGGLTGGVEGAIEGSESGAQLGKGLADMQARLREEEAEALNQQNAMLKHAQDSEIKKRRLDLDESKQGNLDLVENIIDTRTGEPVRVNKKGDIIDSKGEIVDPKYQKNLRSQRENRLASQGQQRINISLGNQDLSRQRFANMVEEQAEADNIRLVEAFDKDPEVRKIRESLALIDPAITALSSGSPMAPGMAGNALARLSGEVGPLTETDLERFGGKQDFLSKINRLKAKQTSGTPLTADDKKQFLFMLNALKELKTGRVEQIRQSKASLYSKASKDIDETKALDTLGSTTVQKKSSNVTSFRDRLKRSRGK